MYQEIAKNRNRTIWLMAIFFIVVAGVGYGLGYIYEDYTIAFGAVVFAIIMNWVAYFKSDSLALASSKARLANPEVSLSERQIVHLVENLCITAGLPMPKVYIIEDAALNAFATGRDPKHSSIALTSGLIANLDKAELEGVIAHELSHIRNYDILLSTVAITLLGIITLMADWMARSRLYSSRSSNNREGSWLAIIAIVFIILAPIFAQLLHLAVSRKREFLADASGAMLTRYPEGLANALTKIQNLSQPLRVANRATAHLFIADPFQGKMKQARQTAASWFSTHPPLEKRIEILRGMNL